MKIVTRKQLKSCFLLSTLLLLSGASRVLGQDSGENGWAVRVTGDYFRCDLDLGVPETSGDATLKGNVWGGSAALKLPMMKPGDWIEASYRRGSLDGRMHNDVFNLDGDAPTDLDHASLLYRWGIFHRPNAPIFKLKLDLLAGANWVHEDLVWTATVPAVATYRSRFEQHVYTGNLGLGGAWTAWTQDSADGKKQFQTGLRADALGGVGAQSLEKHDDLPNFPDFRSEERTDQIWSFDGKGLAFVSYRIGQVTMLAEGGYQWMRFFNVGANDTFKGPIARVGIAYAF